MQAFRFLGQDRRDPLARITWSRDWSSSPLGVVAYRREHLHHWLTPELWRVELGDAVVERELSIVGDRCRLITVVEAWDSTACRDFLGWCVERHPTAGLEPDDVGWTAACCAGYVASRFAGMDAVADGRDFEDGEQAERVLQLSWVLSRAALAAE